MYFVDREELEARLQYLDNITKLFSEKTSWEGGTDHLALERIVHMFIEAMVDVGNQMIDGFIMRDPGSYADVIDILTDEKVVSKEEGESLKKVVALRKQLVRQYHLVDHEQLFTVFKNEWDAISSFTNSVRKYLDTQLGPVNAFLPKK